MTPEQIAEHIRLQLAEKERSDETRWQLRVLLQRLVCPDGANGEQLTMIEEIAALLVPDPQTKRESRP
jgi:hypothetical protein